MHSWVTSPWWLSTGSLGAALEGLTSFRAVCKALGVPAAKTALWSEARHRQDLRASK